MPLNQVLDDGTIERAVELQSNSVIMTPGNSPDPSFHPLGLDGDVSTQVLVARSKPQRAAILGKVGDQRSRSIAGSIPDPDRHGHTVPEGPAAFIIRSHLGAT